MNYSLIISNPIGAINTIIERIEIYPNPVNTVITIRFKTEGNHEIHIVNMLGKQVKRFQNLSKIARIDISDVEEGVYIMRIKKDDKVIAKQIIIQHALVKK
ncbi:MAG: T9SS type A sorting domain-containing protein [Flavobacteriales bacterium]|nr:T9SS type A sorting domain-containing protein [Flavobacteriales bacterium]